MARRPETPDAEDNRRLEERRPVRYAPLRAPVAGQVLDLSGSGMRIETHEALEVGSKTTFTIGHEGRVVRLRGAIMWCEMVGGRSSASGDADPVYRAGVAFLGMSDELPVTPED